MPAPNPSQGFFVGVLDYKAFSQHVGPLIERARRSATSAAALADLRSMAAGIKERPRRDETIGHLDRIDAAVQGNRWNRTAAGHIIEALCVDDFARLPDLFRRFDSCSDFVFAWNCDVAEIIWSFLAHLSDRTIPWASPTDTWRSVVAPADLSGPAEAMDALPPHELRKLLTEAEDGCVFSEQEAIELSEWWGNFRRIARLAQRQQAGLLVSVRGSQ